DLAWNGSAGKRNTKNLAVRPVRSRQAWVARRQRGVAADAAHRPKPKSIPTAALKSVAALRTLAPARRPSLLLSLRIFSDLSRSKSACASVIPIFLLQEAAVAARPRLPFLRPFTIRARKPLKACNNRAVSPMRVG